MIYSIGIVLYTILLLFYVFSKRINFYLYEILVATIYIFTVSFIQTLDITIVLYLIFAILPFIKNLNFKNIFQVIFFCLLGTILVFGIVSNGITNAISIFVIRLIGLVFFVFFFSNYKRFSISFTEKNVKYIVFVLALSELVVGLLGILLTGNISRLMLNYQCTVGCISISGILFLIIYIHKVCHSNMTIMAFMIGLYFCLWPILSGTRGYIIVSLGMLAVIFFIFTKSNIRFFAIVIALLAILVNVEFFWNTFLSITRVSESTGVRSAENELFVLIEKDSSIVNLIFGYGFGHKFADIQNITPKIASVSYDSYVFNAFFEKMGFHNWYTTIFYSSGILGSFVIIYLLLFVFNTIKSNVDTLKYRFALYAYFCLYLFILWYRWTVTSGILEFVTLGVCVLYFSNNNVLMDSNTELQNILVDK